MVLRILNGRRALAAGLGLMLALAGVVIGSQVPPETAQPPAKPSSEHKCPVCGMYVAEYTDFLAAVVFRDGATVFFDGCKDMFRFLFEVDRFAPGRKRADINLIWATDYYSLKWIDGSTAFYVRGSDVLGPMGRELIPFGKETEAKGFMEDHAGESLFRFAEVTPDVLKGID